MSTSEHIEQLNLLRAGSALNCVRAVSDRNDRRLSDDYRNAVEQFPFSARALGFGQALALLCAAGAKAEGRGHRQLYRDLQSWLSQAAHSPYRGADDLLAAVTAGDRAAYRSALIETEAYFAWLKPFAQALLESAAAPQPEATA